MSGSPQDTLTTSMPRMILSRSLCPRFYGYSQLWGGVFMLTSLSKSLNDLNEVIFEHHFLLRFFQWTKSSNVQWYYWLLAGNFVIKRSYETLSSNTYHFA